MRTAWTKAGWIRAALVAALAVGSSCAPHPAAAIRKEPPALAPAFPGGVSSPIVLVTIDGVRWQEIFMGTDPVLSPAARRFPRELAPNLHRLATERADPGCTKHADVEPKRRSIARCASVSSCEQPHA